MRKKKYSEANEFKQMLERVSQELKETRMELDVAAKRGKILKAAFDTIQSQLDILAEVCGPWRIV